MVVRLLVVLSLRSIKKGKKNDLEHGLLAYIPVQSSMRVNNY